MGIKCDKTTNGCFQVNIILSYILMMKMKIVIDKCNKGWGMQIYL